MVNMLRNGWAHQPRVTYPKRGPDVSTSGLMAMFCTEQLYLSSECRDAAPEGYTSVHLELSFLLHGKRKSARKQGETVSLEDLLGMLCV